MYSHSSVVEAAEFQSHKIVEGFSSCHTFSYTWMHFILTTTWEINITHIIFYECLQVKTCDYEIDERGGPEIEGIAWAVAVFLKIPLLCPASLERSWWMPSPGSFWSSIKCTARSYRNFPPQAFFQNESVLSSQFKYSAIILTDNCLFVQTKFLGI